MTDTPTQNEIDHFVDAVGGNDVIHLLNFLKEYPDAVNARNSRGITALFSAAVLGSNMIIRFLLEWGADINRATVEGKTPLMGAAAHAPLKTVELLLERGADESLTDNEGRDVHDAVKVWMRGDVKTLFDSRRAAAESLRRAQAAQRVEKLSGQKPRNPFGKGPSAG